MVHPSIIRVLDFGVEHDIPYLVMEYAPNGTLRQHHARHVPLPVLQVITYTNQVASALQYAHNQRLIYRDVKPENMLLSANGTILLSDFGISTVARTSRSLSTQDISGTAAYMAPEQLQGKVGIASDQYSLAVVVYEWLSGNLPFSGSFAEIASQHMFVQPPSLRANVPEISEEIEQVVMTGLAKISSERFARIEAFAHALEAASSDNDSTSITPSFEQSTLSSPPALIQTVQATPIPDMLTPMQTPLTPHIFTPVPATPLSATLLPNQSIPIPGMANTPQPVFRSYSRRTLFTWITGATILAIAVGAGISYEVFSHPQPFHTPTPQPAYSPEPATPTSSQPTRVVTGQVLNTYTGNHFSVGCAVWSPNGLHIASSGLNVQVWDALTGANVVNYNGHTSQVEAVDWSPDGGSLVSGGDDRGVARLECRNGNDQPDPYRAHSSRLGRQVVA